MSAETYWLEQIEAGISNGAPDALRAAREHLREYVWPIVERSVVEQIAALEESIRAKQAEGWGDPRELALALTALEDCQMRFTRGRAKALGVFRPVDLEKVEAREERARFEAQAGDATP